MKKIKTFINTRSFVLLLFSVILSKSSFAQIWRAVSPDTLYCVDSEDDSLTLKVGIGTSHPIERLHVIGNELVQGTVITDSLKTLRILPLDGDSIIWFGRHTIGMISSSNDIFTDAAMPYDLFLQCNSSYPGNNVILNANGNTGKVGIGTTSPAQSLHIYRDHTSNNYALWTNDLASSGFSVGIDGAGDAQIMQNENKPLTFYTNGVGNERMRITQGGDVGIGTSTPNSKHHIYTSGANAVYSLYTNASNSNSNAGLEVGLASNSDAEIRQVRNQPLNFFTNNTERMRIV